MGILKDLYINSFSNDLPGIIFGVLLWGFTIAVITLIFIGVYYFTDKINSTISETSGIIIEKNFTPASSIITYTYLNNNIIPVVTPISASWSVTIETDQGIDSISVSEEFYKELHENMSVGVKFYKGRISKSFYIKSIL